jgi:hypothetical protein
MLEPSSQQQENLKKIQGSLSLVQFLVIKEDAAFETYRAASERAVIAVRGQRTHCAHIDQFLAGGEMPYQIITVDNFPSSGAVQTAFDAVSQERQAVLTDIYAMFVRPDARMTRIVKALGFLSPVFSRILGNHASKDIPEFADVANPETGPVPETIAEMRQYAVNDN